MPAEPSTARVWIQILGPLSLRVDGSDVSVPGSRRRALLAALARARGRVVGIDRLVDTLWPDDPPANASQALHSHVSRIRGQLGSAGGRLSHRGAGYVLELGDEELDASVARRVAAELPELPPETVLERAPEALALWRGPALEEFRGLPELYAEAVALDEVKVRIQEELLRALIDVGDDRAVAEARSVLAADPLYETGVLLLMRALAGEGRAAEAMTVGAAYRRRLVDETGLDPGPELARLEQDIASGTIGAGARRRAWPARSVVARPSGPLVGRQQDYDEMLRLHAKHRLVTVTGPGGVGKTRLALEAAAALAERDQIEALVVDLAAVEDAARVLQAVASTVGLRVVAATSPSAVDIGVALADAHLLLVLDNAEHVADVCRELVDAVDRHAPGVRVLVTSRLTLHARSEYVLRLQPLPTPRVVDNLAVLVRQPSVRAFLEHARRHDHHYELTAADAEPLVEILKHLDGLPLAIELVARQVAVLPLAAIRDRLGRALDLFSSPDGDEGRQRTLRVTIRWSYDRLSPTRQALLRAVCAFPGGVNLSTIEELAADVGAGQDPVQLLVGLVDASLLDVDRSRSRYRLLFTVRSFLLDEVTTLGELSETEARFLAWAERTATEIGAGLFSAEEARADRRLRAELDNLRAARDLARARGRFDTLVQITLALDQGSIWRDLREVWSWCLELTLGYELDSASPRGRDPGSRGRRRTAGGRLRPGRRARAAGPHRRRPRWCGDGPVLVGAGRCRPLSRRIRGRVRALAAVGRTRGAGGRGIPRQRGSLGCLRRRPWASTDAAGGGQRPRTSEPGEPRLPQVREGRAGGPRRPPDRPPPPARRGRGGERRGRHLRRRGGRRGPGVRSREDR